MTRPLNDDELEQNWTAKNIVMSEDENIDDQDELLSVGSDDEMSDGEEEATFVEESEVQRNENQKRLREEQSSSTIVDKQQSKQSKRKKQLRPLHKVSHEDQLGLLLQTYALHHAQDEQPDLPTLEHLTLAPTNFGKHTLASYTRYIRVLVPSWKFTFKPKNANASYSPVVIILCSSALRAVEILKHLTDFQTHVAKLFAKHMKVHEQVQMLETTWHPLAVGTPNRIKKLIEVKGLSLDCTTHVVLDMQRDSKNFTMLELHDTRRDVLDLCHSILFPRMTRNQLKLGLY